ESGNADPAPASRSTRISSPAAVSLPSASGTRATRRSPGAVSLATPTFMGTTTWGLVSIGDEYERSLPAGRVARGRQRGSAGVAGRPSDPTESGKHHHRQDHEMGRRAVHDRARPPIQPAEDRSAQE